MNKNLIIGQFTDAYLPITDGVVLTVKNYAHWIEKKYGKCIVICPSFPKFIDEDNFDIIRFFSIPMPLRPPYRMGIHYLDLKAIKRVEKIPFHIVHAHSPFSAGLFALETARKRKVPIVATFHTKYYDDFKSATKSDFLARIGVDIIVKFYEKVDQVWTVNSSTAKTLKEYGFKKEIEIIPNGTDIIPPENLEEYKEKINKIYNLSQDDNIFLYVGQLILHKNIKMLIESLYYLKMKGFSFKFLIVGTGKDEKYLKDLVRKLKLDKEVIFVGKIIDRELLKGFYARADLFLFPSLYDASPLVLQEAFALSCPSLLIKGSNASEGIIDGYNGFLSENNAISYANMIEKLIKNKPLLREVGKNAQKTLYRPWEKVIDEVVERYKELIFTYKKNF
jgi:glycosyltransferase involved in cell wall biosynthesis